MNNIDIKIDELFDLVENTNYYKDYVLLKEKVKSNKHIMEIIKEIKRLQKIEVNTHDKEVKEKINELYKELNIKVALEDVILENNLKCYKGDVNDILRVYSPDFCDIMLSFYPGSSIMLNNKFNHTAILIRNNLYDESGLINRANYFLVGEEELNYIRKSMPHLSDLVLNEISSKLNSNSLEYVLRKNKFYK